MECICNSRNAERNYYENIDYELLKKRRERVLQLRAETEQEQNDGIVYELILDGRHYPVMACLPVGTNAGGADDK